MSSITFTSVPAHQGRMRACTASRSRCQMPDFRCQDSASSSLRDDREEKGGEFVPGQVASSRPRPRFPVRGSDQGACQPARHPRLIHRGTTRHVAPDREADVPRTLVARRQASAGSGGFHHVKHRRHTPGLKAQPLRQDVKIPAIPSPARWTTSRHPFTSPVHLGRWQFRIFRTRPARLLA